MKTKMLLITSLLGAALLAGPSALAAGPRGGNGSAGNRGPAPSAPVRNSSGSATTYRGNPNSTGSRGTTVVGGWMVRQ